MKVSGYDKFVIYMQVLLFLSLFLSGTTNSFDQDPDTSQLCFLLRETDPERGGKRKCRIFTKGLVLTLYFRVLTVE